MLISDLGLRSRFKKKQRSKFGSMTPDSPYTYTHHDVSPIVHRLYVLTAHGSTLSTMLLLQLLTDGAIL